MLTVYDRNRLEVLGDLVAQLVRQPTNSPFVPETVIVQSRGIALWRSFRLADGLGVCAPVHFPFPATFIRELFQRVLTYVPETSLCLIGMNNDAFPLARHSLRLDRMAQDVRRGDRSRRDDDRYLFREALLSARRCLYIGYVGRHIRDNSVIPPSVLVSELLDTIARGCYPAINRREMPGCVWS
jgi:exonuclease V gamma subunit